MAILSAQDLLTKINQVIRVDAVGGKIIASEHRQLLTDVKDTLFNREASGVASGLVSALKDGNTADTINSLRLAIDNLAQTIGDQDVPETLRFNFFSDLDTISAQVTMKGPQQASDFYFSSNMVGVSFQVKSDAASSFTAQSDVAAFNSWIGNASNVADSESLWQFYLVADYGSNTGEGSATIVF